MFYDIGGYDERFCGNYGYEDRHLEWKIIINHNIANLDDEVIVLEKGGCGLDRNKEHNKILFNKLKNEL
jgi:predicted glycosyltransferase involved in capsule biosynthesis